MDEITKRRLSQEIGKCAIDYYADTGLCVFCSADDTTRIPHEDWCSVGAFQESFTEERIQEKTLQRSIADKYIQEREE
jgi:hypothetical protein